MARRQRIEPAATLDSAAEAVALINLLSQEEVPTLRLVLKRLLERHPTLVSEARGLLESPRVGGTTARAATLDLTAIRNRIRAQFRETARHFSYGDVTLPRLMDELVDDAQAWLLKGEGTSALALLELVAQEFIDDDKWVEFDNESDFGFGHLGAVFADALLDPDLSADIRRGVLPKLKHWQQQLNNYCGGDEFDLAQEVATVGWDGPVFSGLLAGRLPAEPWREDRRITRARIGFLEQRGLPEVALRVGQVTGLSDAVAGIALRLGRWEVVETEAQRIQEPNAVLQLAETLVERGQETLALRIACAELQRCLHTPDPDDDDDAVSAETYCFPLALWVRDRAAKVGNTPLALTAARKAVLDQPSLADWQRFLDLAGPERETERTAALVRLSAASRYSGAEGQVAILLHEAQGAVAWRLYKSSHNDTLVERIATAVVAELPDEIAKAGRRFAEAIMDSGSSGHYEEAQRWLRLVRTALLSQGKQGEWTTYFSTICALHTRKYKLMGLLREL